MFDKKRAQVIDSNGELVLEAKTENGLYFVEVNTEKAMLSQGITTWHKKSGHLNEDDMNRAEKN